MKAKKAAILRLARKFVLTCTFSSCRGKVWRVTFFRRGRWIHSDELEHGGAAAFLIFLAEIQQSAGRVVLADARKIFGGPEK